VKYARGKDVALTANFRSTEFDCKGASTAKGGCSQTVLETKLFRKLQVLRNRIGEPITISSGYRCAEHNKRVGGVDGSYHMKGYAADIYCSLSPEQLAKAAQEAGFSGIGMYDGCAGRFVHVDIRPIPYLWKNTSGRNVTAYTHGGRKAECPYSIGRSALRQGSRGNGVRAVQWILSWAGYSCSVDGIFGGKTTAAVKAFQRDMCLAPDGIVGEKTRTALCEVSA
ncbi:MAG: peptidoglycan-binding protein, partial [Clostridia bacterium]|nr:peptidoglycan-binding protein [Clostridia bacterium]